MASHNIKPLVYKRVVGGTQPKDGLMTGSQTDKLDNLYTPTDGSGSTRTTNLNTLGKSGFYAAANTAVGSPGTFDSNFYIYHHQIPGVDYAYQIAYPGNNASKYWLKRQKRAGIWDAWQWEGERVPWTNIELNGYFSAYGGGWQTPQYRLVGDVMEFRGLTKCTLATGAAPWGIGTFSSGVGPVSDRMLPVIYYGSGGTVQRVDGRVLFKTTKDLQWYGPAMAVGDYFWLDGIQFGVS